MTDSKIALPRWAGVLIVLMAVITTGQTAWFSWEQQKCNEAFAQNLAARSQWSDQDRAALNQLIIEVFEGGDGSQLRAYHQWRQVTTRNQERRARVSLPELASCD